MTRKANTMLQTLTQVITKQIFVGQTLKITNPSMEVNFVKNNISLLNTTQTLGDSQIKIPSFCDLLSSSNGNCQSSVITQKVILAIKDAVLSIS